MTRAPRREKLLSAAATGLVLTAIGTALVGGLGVGPTARVAEAPTLLPITTALPPPPPRHTRAPVRAAAVRRSAAPGRRGKAAPLVAPRPPLPVLAPQPLAVAHAPDAGTAVMTGAAAAGEDRGAGGHGAGPAGGDGAGRTPPRQTGGRLRGSDLPAAVRAAGGGASVGVRYAVEANGRVGSCEITRSSGNVAVDEVACRVIRARYRFRPERDERGAKVRSYIVENATWLYDRDAPEGDDPADAAVDRPGGPP